MTFEQALTALKQGKKIRRRCWNNTENLCISTKSITGMERLFPAIVYEDNEVLPTMLTADILSDDWEIVEEKPLNGVKVEGLTVKVKANFDDYMQAVDKFRCRLDDLQEATEQLSGMKLEISVDM